MHSSIIYQKIKKASLCLFIQGLLLLGNNIFAQNYAPFGEVFTPKGDIRFLVICAGFKGYDGGQDHGEWNDKDDLPKYLQGDAIELFYTDTVHFSQYEKDTAVKNLSKLYYEMSNKTFRVLADVYPSRININPDSVRGSSWSAVNRAVIQKMKDQSPDFDWSPYDQRENNPNFKFDNSVSSPDGKPDYVVIIYRYDGGWKQQPIKGMNRWLNGANGASSLGIVGVKFNSGVVGSDGFYCFAGTSRDAHAFIGMFKHELGHELFSGPHYMGANEAYGKHFYSPVIGWGSTVSSSHINETLNAWERWLLGWIDISYDVGFKRKKQKFVLKDFATTGAAARIKIPNSGGQFLWVENHQKKSVFDQNTSAGKLINKPEGSSGIPETEKGVLMYVESMLSSRDSVSSSFVYDMSAVNGMWILNAQGNYDYPKPDSSIHTKDWSIYWNNKVYYFKRGLANPYSGINPYVLYRHDFDNSGRIINRGNFNGGRGESTSIVMEEVGDTSKLLYACYGGRNKEAAEFRRSPVFQDKDVLNVVSNPPIVNYPFYNSKKDSIGKVYLNGLNVKLREKRSNDYKVKVWYDDFKIDDDVRLSGNIGIVKDLFTLIRRSEIRLDQSGTVNKIKSDTSGFISPSHLLIENGGGLKMKRNTIVNVMDNSRLIVGDDGELIMKKKAILNLHDNSKLEVLSGAYVEFTQRINLQDNSCLEIHPGAIINGVSVHEKMVFKAGDKVSF